MMDLAGWYLWCNHELVKTIKQWEEHPLKWQENRDHQILTHLQKCYFYYSVSSVQFLNKGLKANLPNSGLFWRTSRENYSCKSTQRFSVSKMCFITMSYLVIYEVKEINHNIIQEICTTSDAITSTRLDGHVQRRGSQDRGTHLNYIVILSSISLDKGLIISLSPDKKDFQR